MRRATIFGWSALLLALLMPTVSWAAKKGWSAHDLPKELTTNAVALVRQDSTVFLCKDLRNATRSHTEVITILNKQGDDYATFLCHTNEHSALRRFRCRLYDASGEEQRSFSLSDVRSTELSEGLADDYTTHYLSTAFPTYPYTVVFEYEVEFTQGFLTLPTFAPAYPTGVAVERSSLTIVAPEAYHYTWRSLNADLQPTERRIKGEIHRKWSVEGLKALRRDSYMPTYEQSLPLLFFAPSEFIYHKTAGKASTWEEYGAWQWGLMEGRDALPEALAAEVHALTDTIPTRRAKIERLYRYLGETTRYVSIQLGIGGLQPMTAEEVWRNRFGDCKALSNYMKGMLKEIGIASNYVEISTTQRRILHDVASASQTNHVILKVPDPEGDLWLECTNTQMPLGFLHDGIAGHDAVVYADGTAHIETLPSLTANENQATAEVSVDVHPDGGASLRIIEHFTGRIHEPLMHFEERVPQDKRIDIARRRVEIATATVDSIDIEEVWSGEPYLRLAYHATASKYGTRAGNRLLLPLTPLAISTAKLNRTRETAIALSMPYRSSQQITLHTPAGYRIERLPSPATIRSDFGSFELQIAVEGEQIRITTRRSGSEGLFDQNRIEELRRYLTAIDKAMKQRIVLTEAAE